MATSKVVTTTVASVGTGDTLASYNIYSDQDGLLDNATPAEANAGHTVSLSDGVVHSITAIPVGISSGEYATGVSNAVSVDLTTSETLLLDNDFSSNYNGIIEQTGSRVTSLVGGAMRMTITQNLTTMLQYIDLSGLGLVNGDSVKVLIDWKSYSLLDGLETIRGYYPFPSTSITPPYDIVGSDGSGSGDVNPPTVETEYQFTYITATNFGVSASSAGNDNGDYFEIDR